MLYLTVAQMRAISLAVTGYGAALPPGHPHETECEATVQNLERIYYQLPEVIREHIAEYEPITSFYYERLMPIVIETDLEIQREDRGRITAFIADNPEEVLDMYRMFLSQEEVALITNRPWRAIKFRNGNEARFLKSEPMPSNFRSVKWSGIYQLIATQPQENKK